jgi:uncharacterized oxidoreductase
MEIIPPYVQTELAEAQTVDPRAMPLKNFIAETMENFKNQKALECIVEQAKPLRIAEAPGS